MDDLDALTLSAWLRNAAAAVRPASLPVLIAVMDDALSSSDRIARVSVATLAAETRSSANTAQRAIADCLGAGVLVRDTAPAGRTPGYRLPDFAAFSGPRRKDLISPANNGGGQIWGTPKTTPTPPKNGVLATKNAAHTKDIESACLPAKASRGVPEKAPVGDQTNAAFVDGVWVKAPEGEPGMVWEALAMANVGNPVRSELCFSLKLAVAREVIAAARERNKSTARLVLDLRERGEAERRRAEHRARIETQRAQAIDSTRTAIDTKRNADAEHAAAHAAALAAIDHASADAIAAAVDTVLAEKGPHIARVVTRHGNGTRQDAARHPRISIDVARVLAERAGVHVVPTEESA